VYPDTKEEVTVYMEEIEPGEECKGAEDLGVVTLSGFDE